ncbi:MAG: AI-2E family transporter [Deltaproteobacteria bacterium]|nr:AI-2E family transporter [Deltaproteobacteria bacterium]
MDASEKKLLLGTATLLGAISLTAALMATRQILVPFVLAFFFYSLLSPLLNRLESRLKIPRPLALMLTVLALLLIAGLLGLFISLSFKDFLQGIPLYEERVRNFIQVFLDQAKSFNLPLDTESIQNSLKNLPVFEFLQDLTTSTLSWVGDFSLVVLFTLFMISGSSLSKKENPFLTQLQEEISRYTATKAFVSLLTGLFAGILLSLFGVELSLLIGVLTFLLNFIPNLGSILATLLPLPLLILQFGLQWQTWSVLVLLLAIQFILGNVVEPKLVGKSLGLHPITILLFLMFWGFVWGLAGLFLAVPLTAVLKIILSRLESTQKLAKLMAGEI